MTDPQTKKGIAFLAFFQSHADRPTTTTQNTTTTHNNQHELLPPYPPAASALSLHGQASGATKSWRRRSPTPCAGRGPSGLGSLSLVPLFGALQRNPSKNREGGKVVALGGRRVVNRHNNQPKFGSDGRGDIGEGARPRRNLCLGCFGCVWGGELSGKN